MILGNSPFRIRLIKALRHLNPDEILLLLSLDLSESSLQGIKALKNSIGIPSGPQALKLGVEEIALQISSSLIPWLISYSCLLLLQQGQKLGHI